MIIHENVVGITVVSLSDYLNSFYIIFTLIMSLHKMGWPGRRDRRVTLLIHKRKVEARIPWSPELVRRCERNCTICFRPFLLAGNSEVEDERAWSMHRSEFDPFEARVGDAEGYQHLPDVLANRMVQALGVGEYNRFKMYRGRWSRCAYILNQDPDAGCATKSHPHVLMTQIRNQRVSFGSTAI